jgi:hypothetical protein
MKPKLLLPLLALAITAISFYVLKPTALETHPPAAVSSNDSSTNNGKLDVPQEEPTAELGSAHEMETEFVYGIEVRKNRNCTVELEYLDIGNGKVIEAYSCKPNQPPAPGVYDEYNNETLAGMAYSDPVAAEVLGKRLADYQPERARMLLMRSVALRPDNTLPILWLASANYGLIDVNGAPALGEMAENYLLARVAEELGTPGAATSIREHLIAAGYQEKDFLDLETEVKVDLVEIRNIQLEVTGQSDLTEVSL